MTASLRAIQRALSILWTLLRFHVSALLPASRQPRTLRVIQKLIPKHPRIRNAAPEARLRLALETLYRENRFKEV